MTGPSFGLAARHPNRPAPVRAYNEAGESIENPTRSQINAMVAALDVDCSFLVVERIQVASDQHYIQTSLDSDFGYLVEHREGDADHHFAANLPPGSAMEVAAVLSQWIDDDSAWRTALPWQPLTFGTE